MSCSLRADLHAVTSGSRTIFLDARKNRYFAVPSEIDAAFQRLSQGVASSIDAALLEPLVTAGLLTGDPAHGSLCQPPLPISPVRALMPNASTSAAALCRCAMAQLRAQRLLCRRSLIDIGALLRARRCAAIAAHPNGRRSFASELAAFDRAGLLFQPLDRCLPASLACCLLAFDNAIPATLVFGVRANPFAAHAWAQRDDEVLNDTIERVRQFTPILAL